MNILPHCPKVFISYRRDPAQNLVFRIKEKLEKKSIDVYLDHEDIRVGEWQEQLYRAIEDKERIFLLVLTPQTLNRCKDNPDDNVLKEIRHAYTHQSICIPIFSEKFDPSDIQAYLPSDLADWVSSAQSARIQEQTLFNASMDEFVDKYLLTNWRLRLRSHRLFLPILYALMGLCLLGVGGTTYAVYDCTVHPPSIQLTDTQNPLTKPGITQDYVIRDVAVTEDKAWLATSSGVWMYSAENARFEPLADVTADTFIVKTNANSTDIWFLRIDYAEIGQIGHYQIETETFETIPLDETLRLNFTDRGDNILCLSVSADGTRVWLGTSFSGIYEYNSLTQAWTNFPIKTWDYNPDIPIPATQIAVYENTPNDIVFWVTNFSLIYRGTNDNTKLWERLTSNTISEDGNLEFYDIAVDQSGNLWVASNQGVQVLSSRTKEWDIRSIEWLNCTMENSALLSSAVYSLGVSSAGTYIWMVGKGGVNIVETEDKLIACDELQWYQWDTTASDDPFWMFSNLSESNLRISAPQGTGSTGWVFIWNGREARTITSSDKNKECLPW